MKLIEVTTLYCPESNARDVDDNSTHHLRPTGPMSARVQRCIYCGKSERELRDAAGKST